MAGRRRACSVARLIFRSIKPSRCWIAICDFPRSNSRPDCFSITVIYRKPPLSSRANSKIPCRILARNLSSVVLVHELIRMNDPAAVPSARRGSLAGWQQNHLKEYIFDHLSEEISLIDLAKVGAVDPFHFTRAFKQTFGEPPYRYLIHRRVERAKRLLEDPTRSVGEIAQDVGFADPGLFHGGVSADRRNDANGLSPRRLVSAARRPVSAAADPRHRSMTGIAIFRNPPQRNCCDHGDFAKDYSLWLWDTT